MRQVLVPLDGSSLAESILPDARQIAGPDGELILIRNAARPTDDGFGVVYDAPVADTLEEYLEGQAALLQAQNVKVQVQPVYFRDVALAIDEAARIFHADLIACATHGRSVLGRLVRGSVAWKAMANSTVPVLLRHCEDKRDFDVVAVPQRIMVPLDGSEYAAKALPLAQELALEWDVPLLLVRIVPEHALPDRGYPYNGPSARADYSVEVGEAEEYLARIASSLTAPVQTGVCVGRTVQCLVDAVDTSTITHVVLASHGRTGLARVVLGSVADSLVHHLHCPIIVVPALASTRIGVHDEVSVSVSR